MINGFNAAGFQADEEKIAYLNKVFGTSYNTLAELEVYNLSQVAGIFDLNKTAMSALTNCAGLGRIFTTRINLTFFGVSDDKVRKKE